MTWMIMQNSMPNFQVAPQFDKMMWPFVKCKQMGGNGRYRISAEVTDSSKSKSFSIRQIIQSRNFYREWTSLRKHAFMPSCHGEIFWIHFNQRWHSRPGLVGGWMNWRCPPCSQEAVEGGDRLFLSSPAAGQNVDTHTRTNLVTEYMDSGYVTCIPRAHHRGESELLFPHPRPESNSKGRL